MEANLRGLYLAVDEFGLIHGDTNRVKKRKYMPLTVPNSVDKNVSIVI